VPFENIDELERCQAGGELQNLYAQRKIGGTAWEYCAALVPIAVLTPAIENREQEVI
jgi:hypothetical protein